MELRIPLSYCVGLAAVVFVATFPAVARSQATSATVVSQPALPSLTMQSNGAVAKLPSNRAVSRMSNMTLHIDARWANNFGYRPLFITATTTKPAAIDRTIKMRLYTRSWDSRLGSIQVEQEFDLPAGATTASMTMSLPQLSQYQWISGQQVSWDVLINGARDRDLSSDPRNGVVAIGAGSSQNVGLSILAVGTAIPPNQSLISNSLEYELFSLAARDLPTRWIDYTCFDVVTLSLAELQALAASKVEALTAIRRWAAAGGQLWIVDAGQSWEKLANVEQILKLKGGANNSREADVASENIDQQVRQRGWEPITFVEEGSSGRVVTFTEYNTNAQRVVRDAKTIDRLQRSGRYYISSESQETPTVGNAIDSQKWFREHRLGVGIVRAFRTMEMHELWARSIGPTSSSGLIVNPNGVQQALPQQPNRNTQQSTETAELTAALDTAADWRSRHGLLPDEPNAEFANWLVQGVGLAPVTAFRVLITLFVLLIGPVNYLLLKRVHRLYLLVVTVPVAAFLLTAALFAYALASDGLHTTVRVRSFQSSISETAKRLRGPGSPIMRAWHRAAA